MATGIAAAFSPPSPADPVGGVGLGYGIAIAVGILVLVSTIMLASYVCVRVKGGGRAPNNSPSTTASAAVSPTAATSAYGAITVCIGLDLPTIESFPKFFYSSSGTATAAGPCPICLAEYGDGEAVRQIPECEHCFHAACLDEWLKVSATCPLCRNSPAPSAATTPMATPLSELVPLAAHRR